MSQGSVSSAPAFAVQGASGASAATPDVSLRGLDITFELKTGEQHAAVKNIGLDIAPGEFVTIVGPTGCGKSTLLNATAGLLKPSAGKVEIQVPAWPG